MAEQVDSTDCIHCDGTAVRATDFKSGTVLEHYRCLACGKKFSPDEATGPMRLTSLDEAKPEPKKTGSKRPSLSTDHKEKLRKARIEVVAKKPAKPHCDPAMTCTKPNCTNEKVDGRAWCQFHVDQHAKYQKPKEKAAKATLVAPESRTVHADGFITDYPELRGNAETVIADSPKIHTTKELNEAADWKTPILQQLDAERMGMYKRLDKLVAAIDAIKAL